MNKETKKFIEDVYGSHEIASISKPFLIKILSTINPMKIDEERFKNIYNKTGARGFECSFTEDAVKEYNSTCKDHQVLQPLPENPPDWFMDFYNGENRFKRNTWNSIIQHYGTPTKKELVSVDELEKEFLSIVRSLPLVGGAFHISLLAQHIIDTYSLNAPKREWWMDCEKFMYKGRVYKKYSYEIFPDGHTVLHAELSRHDIKDCTPYIEPSIHDKVKEKLGTELYEEFMKEVKNG